MSQESFLDLRHRQLLCELSLHGRNFGPGKAARNDALKVSEIGVHVERQAVIGDPPAHGDTDGCDFFLPDPDAGPWGISLRLQTKALERSDRRLLDVPEIAVNIFPQPRFEIHDRIDHHLAWSVIGDIPATAGAKHGHVAGIHDVRFFSAAAESNDMRMLDKKKEVRKISAAKQPAIANSEGGSR